MNAVAVLLLGALLVVVGAVLGGIAFVQMRALRARLRSLEARLARMTPEEPGAAAGWARSSGETQADPSEAARPRTGVAPGGLDGGVVVAPGASAGAGSADVAVTPHYGSGWAAASREDQGARADASAAPAPMGSSKSDGSWATRLQRHWVEILGGVSLAFAGLWLAGLAIERGWFGPLVQVGLGVIAGLAVHALAVFGRKRMPGAAAAWAALAAAGSVTLYALGLAALHLYALIPIPVAFAWLAVVALATMLVARFHAPGLQPWLVGYGLAGGFAAPLWLGSSGDGIGFVLLYVLILSAAGLLFLRARFVRALWLLMVAAGALWGGLAVLAGLDTAWVSLYASGLALVWWGIPGGFGWVGGAGKRVLGLTRATDSSSDDGPPGLHRFWVASDPRAIGMWVGLLAWVLVLGWMFLPPLRELWRAGDAAFPTLWLIVPLLLAGWLAAGSRCLRFAPWLVFSALLLTVWWAGWRFSFGAGSWRLIELQGVADLVSLLAAAAGSMALVGWALQRLGHEAVGASALWFAPLLAVGVAWSVAPAAVASWQLASLLVLTGLALAGWAWRRLARFGVSAEPVWQLLAAHLAYALAVLMLLDGGVLSVALALVVVSAVEWWRRFALVPLDPVIRLLALAVWARLALLPWWPSSVPLEGLAALWPWAGAAALLAVAAWRTHAATVAPWRPRFPGGERAIGPLPVWLDAVALATVLLVAHLALRESVWASADVRAGLFPQVWAAALLTAALWAALALVYARLAGSSVYRLWVQFLWLGAAGWLLLALLPWSPLWQAQSHADWLRLAGDSRVARVVWLIVLLASPALLLWFGSRVAAMRASRLAPWIVPGGRWLAVVTLVVALVLAIRTAWNGGVGLWLGRMDGEWWSYTALGVGVAIAAPLLLRTLAGRLGAGAATLQRLAPRFGAVLLATMAGKVFLLDSWMLGGYWRIAAFAVLGAGLIVLAVTRMQRPEVAEVASSSLPGRSPGG